MSDSGPVWTVTDIRIRLLGAFAISVDGQAIPDASWRLRKAKDVVKLLALAPGHRLHKEVLAEQLWAERPPAASENSLHQAIHAARRALGRSAKVGQPLLPLREGFLALSPDAQLWVDVDAFEAAARKARAEGDLASYQAARALYGGELLPDDRYQDWATPRRDAARQTYLSLLADLAGLQESNGEANAAIETLREQLDLDPLDEAAHGRLMRLYAVTGQRRLALQQFHVLRTTLARELQVEPAEASRHLYEEILQGRVADLPATSPAIQTHRATPKPGARPRPPHPNNLPLRLSSFVGREREMADIRQLLTRTRILTLTGAGGCGKSRLAVEVAAASLRSFSDGVWLVELAALSDPSQMIQAVAEVFDVREQPGRPLVDLVVAHLADRMALLVLDNCEHLVQASASVSESLLSACPGLRVLATSREPLRVPGEAVFPVPPLAVAVPERGTPVAEIAALDSVRLFTERAQAVTPGFTLSPENAETVARLCYRLDGLPLAIELAASRISLLPVGVIEERLRDRFQLLIGGRRTVPSRHQTLKATLDWSYNLLSEPERMVFRRLAVFVGSFSLEAAEGACGDGKVAVLSVLTQLADKSLVVPHGAEARFRLLETVREYGLERLAESGERVDAETAHARWFADMADRARTALAGPSRGSWLTSLEAEHDNLRAALARSLAADPQRALHVATCLWPFWLWRGYLAEGRRWLDLALTAARGRSADRAEALLGAAALTIRSGRTREGGALAEEAVELAGDLEDHRRGCRALQVLGVAAWSEDDLIRAARIYRESEDLARRAGFEPGRAAAMHARGIVAWYAGDHGEALHLLDESLTRFRALSQDPELAPPMLDVGEIPVPQPETGSLRLVFQETFAPFEDISCRAAAGFVLANRGMLARAEGYLDRGRADLEASLAQFEELGDDRAVAQTLARLGNLAVAEGQLERARGLLEDSLALRRRIGDSRGATLTEASLGNLALAEGDVERAERLLSDSAATFRRRSDLWGYSAALGNLANLAMLRGNWSEARRLLEDSLAAIRETGRTRWMAWGLVQLAAVTRMEGDEHRGRKLVEEALGIFVRIGDRRGTDHCRDLLAVGASAS